MFAGLCFILFVNLGLWQLTRADEKRELLAEREMLATQPPVPVSDLAGDVADGLRIRLNGQFGDETWLLDNRVLDGAVGFEVLQVFRDVTKREFVVNRGFVPAGRTREELPVIPEVPANVSIVGKLKAFTPGVLIGEAPVMPWEGEPVVVQQADTLELSESSGRHFFRHIVLLDENQPGALPRYWPDTVMLPAQHHGYAVQWFAMAIAVIVVWGFFTWRKTNE